MVITVLSAAPWFKIISCKIFEGDTLIGFRFWNGFRGDNPPYTLSIFHSVTHSDNILKRFRCCNIRDTIEIRRAVAGPKQFQAITSYGSPS